MGEFKFRTPDFWEMDARHVKTIHVVGMDGIPRPCRVQESGDQLVVHRNHSDSGRIYVSYPFTHRGELTVCTGTLPESDRIYDFATEIARGTINRLRNQSSIWLEGGLEISDEVTQLTQQATSYLCRSVVGDVPEKDLFAQKALDDAIEAIFLLSEQFGRAISEFRVSETEIPSFWLAAAPTDEREVTTELEDLFDLFVVRENGNGQTAPQPDRTSIAGPWLDASPNSPFCKREGDYQQRRSAFLEDCSRQLEQLPTGTSLIHAACGLNGVGHRYLSYPNQNQLTTDLLTLIDDSNVELPVLVSFDYPWAEKLAWSVGGTHPLQIADELMRNGSKISFIGLDINLDFWPGGSLARDPLQWIDLIDVWCQLGLPLILCLRVPDESSAMTLDPLDAESECGIAAVGEQHDAVVRPQAANEVRRNLSSAQRLELLKTILPMVVARPGVHGIIWRQWSDSEDPRFPHAGLVDTSGHVKSIPPLIDQLRRETLRR